MHRTTRLEASIVYEQDKRRRVRGSIAAIKRLMRVAPLTEKIAQTEKLIAEGTSRLIARADDSHSLVVDDLALRIRAALEKYLLRDDPSANADAINEFLDSLHADDLCLIVACERGDQTAWDDLVERFGATVRSAARATSSNEDAADDLAQSIWAELYGLRVRADGRPAGKLAYYSGRGSLGGWLRAVVGQLAVDQHRKISRLVQTEEDADFDRLARASNSGEASFSASQMPSDPESALVGQRVATDIESGLARALGELGADDRLLVKLYYFDGLRLREAGAVLGVHEATASRRLTRIHSEIRKRVETILIKEKGWTRSETERSLSAAAVQLETDMEMLLADHVPDEQHAQSGD